MGVLQIHETIPLQILISLTKLFEVGHTSPPTVQMHESLHGLGRSSWRLPGYRMSLWHKQTGAMSDPMSVFGMKRA